MNKGTSYLLVSLIVFISSCEIVTKHDFFIPQNFTGQVAIVYDSQNGIDPPVKNGRKQYIIPDSGIFFSKEHFQSGTLDDKFYTRNNDSSVKELSFYQYQKDSTKNYIHFDRIENIVCATDDKKTKSFFIRFFYVGAKWDSASDQKRFFFTKRVRQLCGCVD